VAALQGQPALLRAGRPAKTLVLKGRLQALPRLPRPREPPQDARQEQIRAIRKI